MYKNVYGKNEFTIFSYHATCDDWYGRQLARIKLPSSLQTPENTRLYKDAGFNVLFISYAFPNCDIHEDFEECKLKKVMDMAHAEGMKCFIFDNNIHRLTSRTHSLIDPENPDGINRFATEDDLDDYIRKCLAGVSKHPAFIGVSTRDEPIYTMYEAYGQGYRALKRVFPDIYINANLIPYALALTNREHKSWYSPREKELTPLDAYRDYVQMFYDNTKADFIQYDDYPIREHDEGYKYLLADHITNAHMVARMCREWGIPFAKVFQACAGKTSGRLWRKCNETDMYWQMHIGMAFGVKIYSYWSYYPVINTNGEFYDDDANFVDTFGRPNKLYYIMQKIHGEMQKAAKVLTRFEFEGAKVFTTENIPGYLEHATTFNEHVEKGWITDDKLHLIKSVKLQDDGIVLVTELKDDETGELGYYIVNVTDPMQKLSQTVTVEFKGNSLFVLENGEESKLDLQEGKTAFALGAGQGVFVIPKN